MGRNGQQYYYMYPCFGSSRNDMPFNLLGRHYYTRDNTVTGLDYITFELFDYNDDLYYVWVSLSINAYASSNTNPNSLYDSNPPSTQNLISGQTTTIGSRFSFYFQKSGNRVEFTLNILQTGCEVSGYMRGQWQSGGRWRMHYLQISPPSCYKCHTCGLFGYFARPPLAGNNCYMELCNGGFKIFPKGWGSSVPIAYDIKGWSWWKRHVETTNSCRIRNRRRRTRRRRSLLQASDYEIELPDDYTYIDPCNSTIKTAVVAACQLSRTQNSYCCDLIGGGFCDELQANCELDACVNADGNINIIDEQVTALFNETLALVCSLPDASTQLDANNLVPEPGYDTMVPSFSPTSITSSPSLFPTTAYPTTSDPTAVPTTAMPTSPTTAIPTTAVPTTALPTTAPIATTAKPTTALPTTSSPTVEPTVEPTNNPNFSNQSIAYDAFKMKTVYIICLVVYCVVYIV